MGILMKHAYGEYKYRHLGVCVKIWRRKRMDYWIDGYYEDSQIRKIVDFQLLY